MLTKADDPPKRQELSISADVELRKRRDARAVENARIRKPDRLAEFGGRSIVAERTANFGLLCFLQNGGYVGGRGYQPPVSVIQDGMSR